MIFYFNVTLTLLNLRSNNILFQNAWVYCLFYGLHLWPLLVRPCKKYYLITFVIFVTAFHLILLLNNTSLSLPTRASEQGLKYTPGQCHHLLKAYCNAKLKCKCYKCRNTIFDLDLRSAAISTTTYYLHTTYSAI